MALDRIIISNFRNHSASELDQTARFNLLIGDNGAGKTNVLEALSLLAPGRGLRRAPITEMARDDAGQGAAQSITGGFAIGASLKEQGHESARIGTQVEPEQPGRRLVRINGANTSAASLGEWLAMGWLTPAMDGLFTDSAGARRRYIDRMALAVDPSHARNTSRYEAAIRERNKLLEDSGRHEATWLDAIEAQAAEFGALVAGARRNLVTALCDELSALPDEPFAKPLLTYRAGGPTDFADLRDELHRTRLKDRAAGRALIGPHRDELEVVMASTEQAAARCSTGEQKAMLIAITLAHAGLAAEGRPGVLLLDEVAAHLDAVRRSALFERLRQGAAQVWFTGTETAPFAEILEEAAVWRISGGTLERL